ncbi:hypothetical protein [Sphingobium sp.]|uniref:hypothetical protein n=1 Tax=Sphingobium sp. TaxID=1912891 RepID=UPI0028BD20A4|nr:hypothetical protein [Sphingobium sp.]
MAPSPPLQDQILTYAETQAALVRVEERLRLSPVRQPWKARMALAERQALAAADSLELPEDAVSIDGRGRVVTSAYDLTHWKAAIGVSVPLDTLRGDPNALLAWLGTDRWTDRDIGDRIAAIDRWCQACRALPPSPPLLHSARIAALWRQHAPLGRGDLVASLLIGDRWGPGRWSGSQGGLIALGLRHVGGLWKVARGANLDRIWLDAIRAGAQAHCEWEVRLRSYAQRASTHLAARRRPGRLKDLLLFAMARPFVTSSHVAERLGLTSAGAIKLLTIAVGEGLLLERTGQASYRRYMIPVSAPSPVVGRPSRDPFEPDFWEQEAENTLFPAPL